MICKLTPLIDAWSANGKSHMIFGRVNAHGIFFNIGKMSRQLTLFGSMAKLKDFIIQKAPEDDSKFFIESLCLRAR